MNRKFKDAFFEALMYDAIPDDVLVGDFEGYTLLEVSCETPLFS